MELDKRNDKQAVILQNLLPWKASYTTVPKDCLVASNMTLK